MTMLKKQLDGPQKAAIFLMAMGDEFTQHIFKGLTDHEIKLLGKRMATLEDVTIPVDVIRGIMDEFQRMSSQMSGVTGKGLGYLKESLVSALGPEKAKPILDAIAQATDKAAFSSLKGVDSSILMDYLKGEWALVDGTKVIAHAARRNTISLLREGRRRLISALAKAQPAKAKELEGFAEPLLENDFPNQDKLLGAEAAKTMVLLQETVGVEELSGLHNQINQVLDGNLGSFADPDARNGRQKKDDPFFGYKVIATCNEKGIVQAASVLPGNESELGQVQDQIAQLEENGVNAKRLAADKGYDSNGNRELAAEHHLKPYIPAKKTSREKTGFPFQYDRIHDCLVCRTGKRTITKTPSRHGYVFSFSVTDCRECPYAAGCLTKSQRRRQVFFDPDTGKHKPRGFKRAMHMRKAIERVFGEAKVWHRMSRARYRGLDRVKVQILMTFMVMNVKKMAKAMA